MATLQIINSMLIPRKRSLLIIVKSRLTLMYYAGIRIIHRTAKTIYYNLDFETKLEVN